MKKDWQYIVEYYKDWVNNEQEIFPLYDLARKIAESEYAEELHACTSVGTLCVSVETDYSASLNIQYLKNQTFKVNYSPNFDTNLIEKHKCHSSQVFSLLESLFLRLKLESEEIRKTKHS